MQERIADVELVLTALQQHGQQHRGGTVAVPVAAPAGNAGEQGDTPGPGHDPGEAGEVGGAAAAVRGDTEAALAEEEADPAGDVEAEADAAGANAPQAGPGDEEEIGQEEEGGGLEDENRDEDEDEFAAREREHEHDNQRAAGPEEQAAGAERENEGEAPLDEEADVAEGGGAGDDDVGGFGDGVQGMFPADDVVPMLDIPGHIQMRRAQRRRCWRVACCPLGHFCLGASTTLSFLFWLVTKSMSGMISLTLASAACGIVASPTSTVLALASKLDAARTIVAVVGFAVVDNFFGIMAAMVCSQLHHAAAGSAAGAFLELFGEAPTESLESICVRKCCRRGRASQWVVQLRSGLKVARIAHPGSQPTRCLLADSVALVRRPSPPSCVPLMVGLPWAVIREVVVRQGKCERVIPSAAALLVRKLVYIVVLALLVAAPAAYINAVMPADVVPPLAGLGTSSADIAASFASHKTTVAQRAAPTLFNDPATETAALTPTEEVGPATLDYRSQNALNVLLPTSPGSTEAGAQPTTEAPTSADDEQSQFAGFFGMESLPIDWILMQAIAHKYSTFSLLSHVLAALASLVVWLASVFTCRRSGLPDAATLEARSAQLAAVAAALALVAVVCGLICAVAGLAFKRAIHFVGPAMATAFLSPAIVSVAGIVSVVMAAPYAAAAFAWRSRAPGADRTPLGRMWQLAISWAAFLRRAVCGTGSSAAPLALFAAKAIGAAALLLWVTPIGVGALMMLTLVSALLDDAVADVDPLLHLETAWVVGVVGCVLLGLVLKLDFAMAPLRAAARELQTARETASATRQRMDIDGLAELAPQPRTALQRLAFPWGTTRGGLAAAVQWPANDGRMRVLVARRLMLEVLSFPLGAAGAEWVIRAQRLAGQGHLVETVHALFRAGVHCALRIAIVAGPPLALTACGEHGCGLHLGRVASPQGRPLFAAAWIMVVVIAVSVAQASQVTAMRIRRRVADELLALAP